MCLFKKRKQVLQSCDHKYREFPWYKYMVYYIDSKGEEMNENRWILTDEIRNEFKPLVSVFFQKLENMTPEQAESAEDSEFEMNLSDMGINPYQLRQLLEEMGYEHDYQDDNGWELDFWVYMNRKDGQSFPSCCERMVISGCGMTFELKLGVVL